MDLGNLQLKKFFFEELSRKLNIKIETGLNALMERFEDTLSTADICIEEIVYSAVKRLNTVMHLNPEFGALWVKK